MTTPTDTKALGAMADWLNEWALPEHSAPLRAAANELDALRAEVAALRPLADAARAYKEAYPQSSDQARYWAMQALLAAARRVP